MSRTSFKVSLVCPPSEKSTERSGRSEESHYDEAPKLFCAVDTKARLESPHPLRLEHGKAAFTSPRSGRHIGNAVNLAILDGKGELLLKRDWPLNFGSLAVLLYPNELRERVNPDMASDSAEDCSILEHARGRCYRRTDALTSESRQPHRASFMVFGPGSVDNGRPNKANGVHRNASRPIEL